MIKKRSYGGREPLDEEDRKSEVIKVRLTKDEVFSLKGFHKKSYLKNFSDLIREALFRNAIKVKVANLEVSNIMHNLKCIKDSCDNMTRSRRRDLIDFQSEIALINSNIQDIQNTLNEIQKTDLFLVDLREIEEEKKRKLYYPRRGSWY